ncbi:hypothetical protein QM996_02580 [Sinorhizobium chiapasense]
MASTPKETTTKTEPWDGAKPYITKYLAQADKLYSEGKPEYYKGDTIAGQSSATTDALKQQEAIARGGFGGIKNAQGTVDAITQGKNFSAQPNQTLSQLQNGIALGNNPAQSTANSIANGSQSGKAPGQNTLNQSMNYTDPAMKATAGLAGSLTNNYSNPGVAATQDAAKGIASSYTNPGVAATQGALNSINTNYTNPATAQAANYGNFTNAASGLQTQQANALASGNNPAMDYLRSTASGNEIGKNPYLDQMVANQQNKIADQLRNVTNPGIDSQAASLGRMGSASYASARNNADTTAATAMSQVATDMYGNQYNTDKDRQMSAAGQYGNFYNTDQQNQMQVNANLANTSNSQQQNRMQGTQLYGDLNNAQENLRNDAINMRLNGAAQLGNQSLAQQGMNNDLTNMRLNAANQLGNQSAQQQGLRNDQTNLMLGANNQWSNQSLAQNGQRLDAANSANSQYQFDRNLQMQGLGLQNDIYQQGIGNQFKNNDQRLNAANSQFANQNAQANTQLQGAGMAGDMYGLGYLPSQYLSQVGAQKDQRSQDELNAKIQRHDFEQNQPLANIANMINLANGGNYSNTTTPVYSNTAGQIGGALTGLLGLLSMCDERTKIVFECVGKFPNGIPMYRFAYKDNPDEVFIGPLAQEVEAVMPDAVIEINGIKHIITDTFMEAA